MLHQRHDGRTQGHRLQSPQHLPAHAATLGVDTFAISQHDRILLLPSMFHANAWGLPYSALVRGRGPVAARAASEDADAIRRMIRESADVHGASCRR